MPGDISLAAAAALLQGTNRAQYGLTIGGGSGGAAASNNTKIAGDNKDRPLRGGTGHHKLILALKDATGAKSSKARLNEMMAASRVTTTKEHDQWNWDLVGDILDGPLQNPDLLVEALKSKFLRRLLGYFRCDPGDKGYFGHLPWSSEHLMYIMVARRAILVLLNSGMDTATNFLITDRRGRILSEIAEGLKSEIDYSDGKTRSTKGAKSRIFSPAAVASGMVREYFTILGLFSSSSQGVALMMKVGIFNVLRRLGESEERDYLRYVFQTNISVYVSVYVSVDVSRR